MSHKFPIHKMAVSHRNDTHSGGEAPRFAHLAHGTLDELTPITGQKGDHLFIIEDPKYAASILEVIIEKVVFENHIFKGIRCVAYSRSLNSTRRLFLTAAWEGDYKSALDSENKKVEQQMDKLGGKDNG